MRESAAIRVVGVHLVPEATGPCHLVELVVCNAALFRIDDVTQKVEHQPPSQWQVPYDECVMEAEGAQARYAFFFHYLQLDQPLLTSLGPVALVELSPLPERLRFIKYEAP
jgi:hypothetical protein